MICGIRWWPRLVDLLHDLPYTVATTGISRIHVTIEHKVPGSSNGRTPGSGPGYLGSNPGPGTLCLKLYKFVRDFREGPLL